MLHAHDLEDRCDMIISRTPVRVSFCGGGTDLPEYYLCNGGCVISTTINKYIYVTLSKSFHQNLITLKYSAVEKTDDVRSIKHPIFNEVLSEYFLNGIEINSISDIPAGTGMGSSSAFTIGLLNAVRVYRHLDNSKKKLADLACDIEINRLGENIGKQDQYATSFGGLNFIKFNTNDNIEVEPIQITNEDKQKISDNLMLFYTGGTRNASDVLKKYSSNNPITSNKKKQLVRLTEKLRDELNRGNIDYLGKNLEESWNIKKSLAKGISNFIVDEIHSKAIENGAVGGKLLGAGGNGFLLIYAEKNNQEAIRNSLKKFIEVPFNFEEAGTSIVYNDNWL